MGESPQFPPIPDIGENVLKKKDKLTMREFSVIKCSECKTEDIVKFKPGDYTYKELKGVICEHCQRDNTLTITEIFSEWYNPKKEK